MADTFIKRPVLYKGTKAQIESATMGENDFAIATDVEFYTKEEVDSLIAGAGGGGLESVSHDASLTGTGTADSPLGIASTVTAQINSKADQTAVDVLSGEVSGLMGDFAQLPSTYVAHQTFADTITEINTDTTSIKETLNGKANADLDNITSVAKTKIVNAGQPDYSAGISVGTATILAGYTAPSAGFLATSAGWLNLTVNGNILPTGKYIFANNAVSLQQIFIPLNKGDVIVGTGGYQIDSNIFFPLKEI